MGKEEDWNINDFIQTARTPEQRAELRRTLEDIQDGFDVKEIRKGGGVYLRIRHKETGVEIERKCGASQQRTYVEAITELIDKLPPESE